MVGGIPEKDWRIFRELHAVWLNRYCAEVNDAIRHVLSDGRLTSHERYLKIYKLIHQKGRKIGYAFNDFRRSTATMQLCIIRNLGVVTEEEFTRFSESTRRIVLADWRAEAE
jgi:hypothetical protein